VVVSKGGVEVVRTSMGGRGETYSRMEGQIKDGSVEVVLTAKVRVTVRGRGRDRGIILTLTLTRGSEMGCNLRQNRG
jgi:hypothetical protein